MGMKRTEAMRTFRGMKLRERERKMEREEGRIVILSTGACLRSCILNRVVLFQQTTERATY
jgi:hypothetical protein